MTCISSVGPSRDLFLLARLSCVSNLAKCRWVVLPPNLAVGSVYAGMVSNWVIRMVLLICPATCRRRILSAPYASTTCQTQSRLHPRAEAASRGGTCVALAGALPDRDFRLHPRGATENCRCRASATSSQRVFRANDVSATGRSSQPPICVSLRMRTPCVSQAKMKDDGQEEGVTLSERCNRWRSAVNPSIC